MGEYHTQRAFDDRTKQRKENPKPLPEPEVFYHVACLNNWEFVVREQLRLLKFSGLTKTTTCVIGTIDSARHLIEMGKQYGVDVDVVTVTKDQNTWEHPTIYEVWKYANTKPDGSIVYLHSKGVTQPNSVHKILWRWLMQKYVVYPWRENLKKLEFYDAIGIDWQDNPHFPHFSGNFWTARCDWVKHLDNPRAFSTSKNVWIAGHPWIRMHVEMWVGSKPYHHIESPCCRNENLWCGEDIFKHKPFIEGFEYELPEIVVDNLGKIKR